MNERWSVSPLTIGALVAIAGLVGFGVSAGIWSGAITQKVEAHEARISRLESVIFDLRSTLGRIDRKLERISR